MLQYAYVVSWNADRCMFPQKLVPIALGPHFVHPKYAACEDPLTRNMGSRKIMLVQPQYLYLLETPSCVQNSSVKKKLVKII